MEISLAKAERAYLKLIIGGLGALVVFVLLCWGGFRFYRNWQEGHLVRRAAAFMSGGDLKTASLNARRALQLNPGNAGAMRVIAEIAEKAGDPAALDWRRKVLASNPTSTDDALALVRAAMWFNDLATAEKTLNAFDESAKQKAGFHAASGRLAELKKDVTTAEGHWAKAAEFAPEDTAYRFQLALVRLGLNDRTKREAGLAVLETLRSDPKQRAAATRSLIIDGVTQRGDPQRLRALASELQAFPGAPFSDCILYLEILRQMRDPAYEEYLSKLKAEAPAKPSDLASLLSWMVHDQMSAEAIGFANSLPAETLAKWPVPLALAEAYAQAKDWLQLERLTKNSSWSAYDFLRRAYLARAFRGQDKTLAAQQELAAAQKEAGTNPQTLSTLTQTIAGWGWQNEAVELLWILTKNPEMRMGALRALYDYYAKIPDTPGLYRTLTRFADISPNDAIIQNNLAQISLLLGADVDHARKMAAELTAKEPSNPAYRSTYAFALLSKGDIEGALKLMDGLSPDQLRDPSVATYYGLILSAAGQKEKAREFLRRSSEATLLPEEKALVAKAESRLE